MWECGNDCTCLAGLYLWGYNPVSISFSFLTEFLPLHEFFTFAETGTVAETIGELWQESRSSYRVGVRMVTGSGSIYRFDVAAGEEGSEVTLFFFCPWQPDVP